MKKEFTITKEHILLLAEQYSWSESKLKEWFPQAFESELEVGKWYKGDVDFKSLIYITDLEKKGYYNKISYYGFTFGRYNELNTISNSSHEKSLVTATDKEVETALIAEAKRRGFINGVTFKSIDYSFNNVKIIDDFFKFDFNNNDLYLKVAGKAGQRYRSVFLKGKWAEIISEPIELTLEQRIERIEEQLKIKK